MLYRAMNAPFLDRSSESNFSYFVTKSGWSFLSVSYAWSQSDWA
jgi:hypothetical protein